MFMSPIFSRARLPRLALSVLGLVLAASAQAGEAGRIVLVHGSAQIAAHTLALGDPVAEGDTISTGKDGYVYLRTIDNGLLILRPSSKARIVTYQVDTANPANTRIKLELLSGVARSVSGEAVKLARQNFRFNTPVAAIGVRGTDFTVYTDNETSRVTVLSGGVVVSGFSGSCSPDGGGPCEHAVSRELSAAQVGQMLQVGRGTAVPQLMSASPALAPDAVAPPRGDEPQAKAGAPVAPASAIEPSLDPQKAGGILQQGNVVVSKPGPVSDPAPPPSTMPPPVATPVATPVTTPVATPAAPLPQLVWGRWQAAADQAATLDTAKLAAEGAKRATMDSNFAIYRTAGSWTMPSEGVVGFKLMNSQALVRDELTSAVNTASIENGKLNVDFGASKFSTSFDLVNGAERFALQAKGLIGNDGQLSGNSQFSTPTNMLVNGALSPENGMSAAYIFTSRLDTKRIASGITYWNKQ